MSFKIKLKTFELDNKSYQVKYYLEDTAVKLVRFVDSDTSHQIDDDFVAVMSKLYPMIMEAATEGGYTVEDELLIILKRGFYNRRSLLIMMQCGLIGINVHNLETDEKAFEWYIDRDNDDEEWVKKFTDLCRSQASQCNEAKVTSFSRNLDEDSAVHIVDDTRRTFYISMLPELKLAFNADIQNYLDSESFINRLTTGKFRIEMHIGDNFFDGYMGDIDRYKRFITVKEENICGIVRRIYVADDGGDNPTICVDYDTAGPKGDYLQELLTKSPERVRLHFRAVYGSNGGKDTRSKIDSLVAITAFVK